MGEQVASRSPHRNRTGRDAGRRSGSTPAMEGAAQWNVIDDRIRVSLFTFFVKAMLGGPVIIQRPIHPTSSEVH